MSNNSLKYHEPPLPPLPPGAPLELKIGPPEPLPFTRRRRVVGKRVAAPHRRQLVCLGVDDSRSMFYDGKAEAATNACQEMLYRMELGSTRGPCFDVALFAFGDYIFANNDELCQPCNEIDADEVSYRGTSGGTKIKQAMVFIEDLLEQYEHLYLRHHSELDVHPVPLIILLSDGKNGDGNPVPVAERIKSMPLSIGVPPMIVTVGIEYGGDTPDVELLKNLASSEDRRPLYFDISQAELLVEFLAEVGSSGSSSPAEVINAALRVNPDWRA